MKLVNANVAQILVFVILNNVGMKINVDANAKNQLIKVYVTRDLFRILVTVNVNAINLVTLVNIQIIQIVSVRKKLFYKLIEERTKSINEVEIDNKNENKHKCNSCAVYIALFSIILVINIRIGIYFVYSHWYLKKDIPRVKFNTRTQTAIQ